MGNNQIVIYQIPDGEISLDMTLDQDTNWPTQAQIVAIFHSSKANTSQYIKHLYNSKELDLEATIRTSRDF